MSTLVITDSRTFVSYFHSIVCHLKRGCTFDKCFLVIGFIWLSDETKLYANYQPQFFEWTYSGANMRRTFQTFQV